MEPPDIANVEASFEYLFDAGMISHPSDSGLLAHTNCSYWKLIFENVDTYSGELTTLGRFSGSMSVDLQLSRLVFYGILLGMGDYACVLAAALSLSKTLFRVASPFIHTNPAELNDIVKTTLIGAAKIDDGMILIIFK